MRYLRNAPAIVRFIRFVDFTENCWLWNGGHGCYGMFWLNGKTIGAHVFSYNHWVGEVPEGLVLDHECNTPLCVNPLHLKPKTQKANTLRGIGPAALNARKTHCPKGHPYDERNTCVKKTGFRSCRKCAVIRVTNFRKKYGRKW